MTEQHKLLLNLQIDLLGEIVNADLAKCWSIAFAKSTPHSAHNDGIVVKIGTSWISIYITTDSKLKYVWHDLTKSAAIIDIANPDWINDIIKMIKFHECPQHMCGLSGYNPILGDTCPACECSKV